MSAPSTQPSGASTDQSTSVSSQPSSQPSDQPSEESEETNNKRYDDFVEHQLKTISEEPEQCRREGLEAQLLVAQNKVSGIKEDVALGGWRAIGR